MPTHAVVWIDHKEARIFHVHPDATDSKTVLAQQHQLHRHPKGSARSDARVQPEAREFFADVSRALDGADAVLIVGPSTAKLEFYRFLHEHDHLVEAKVIGVESADHPTDGEIVARARLAFAADDQLS